MARLIPKTEGWRAQLQANPSADRSKLKETLNLGESQLTNLLTLQACFDPEALEKVRQAEIADPPFALSLNSALALARLKGKVSDLPGSVHAALDVILARQLATTQIKDLVEWMTQGNSADTFQESGKSKAGKTNKKGSTQGGVSSTTETQPSDLDKIVELAEQFKAEKARGNGETTAKDKLAAYLESMKNQGAKNEIDKNNTSNKKSKKAKGNPSLFWEWVAGISFFSQLKSKIKKGETLTVSEKLFVLGDRFLKFAGKILKHGAKWVHKGSKFVWDVFIEFLKMVGIYKFVRSVVILTLVALFLWTAWDMRQHGLMHPFRTVWSFIPRTHSESTPPNPEPENAALAQVSKPEIKKQTQSPKVTGTSHPPVIAFVEGSDTQETKPYLDQELHGIPDGSVITAVAVQPDSAMGGDMAYRRLTDMQGEKYSVRWGNDKVSVVTINPTASNLILKVQSGISLLDGPSNADFYWEEVKALHCDEIKTTTIGKPIQKTYQISLFLAESKKTITIQCATPADLQHLVSALEYYIKLSRGNIAPITPMPYLNQGIRFDNNGEIKTLWADSPMDKAGLVLGDFIWSVEKYTEHQQSKSELEAALQALTPGPHIAFKVIAKGWKMALANKIADDPDSFRPLRRKVSLQIP
jgi:hypothetical protein